MSRCSREEPPVRFPFRLKGRQPVYCGYPGFDLLCDTNGQTVIELPVSVKLHVKKIDYKSQSIQIDGPDGCLPRHLPNLNLSASPFRFIVDVYGCGDFFLFNCSLKNYLFTNLRLIPCLSRNGYYVHALESRLDYIETYELPSCAKMNGNLTSIPYTMFYESKVQLNWSNPICGRCEEQGQRCRLTSNSRQSEAECFNIQKPRKGQSRATLPIIFFVDANCFGMTV